MSGVFSPLNKHFIEPLFTLTTAERVLFIASKKKKKQLQFSHSLYLLSQV